MSYANIFNSMLRDPRQKTINHIKLERIIADELDSDVTFVQNVYVVVPEVKDVPGVCTDIMAEF